MLCITQTLRIMLFRSISSCCDWALLTSKSRSVLFKKYVTIIIILSWSPCREAICSWDDFPLFCCESVLRGHRYVCWNSGIDDGTGLPIILQAYICSCTSTKDSMIKHSVCVYHRWWAMVIMLQLRWLFSD